MSNLKGKKLLILGGFTLSNEIIKHARGMGVKVYVTDYLTDSPSKKYADKSFMVSTTDVDGLTKLIEVENIDGILTGFSDMLLPYYQQICERTNKPCYASREQIEILTNKIKFKQLCRNFNIPVVEDYDIKPPFNKDRLAKLKYPVLLKPTDNGGGKGIFICKTQEELINNYEKSLCFSIKKQLLVERYMNAKEVTIFYVVQNGNICLTAIGDRHVKHFNDGIIPLPVGYSFPSNYLEKYQISLNEKVIEMFKSIDIKNGMIFIQSFVEKGEFVFYEVGYRLTGSLEYKLISHASGFDPMDFMIQYSLAGKMNDIDTKKLANPKFHDFYCNITLLAKPGKIGEIRGIEKAMAITNVLDVVLSYEEGDTISEEAIGTLAQVIVRIFAFANSKIDLVNIIDKVQDSIRIYSSDGEDLLLPQLDSTELFNY